MYSEDYVRETTALGSVQKAMASVNGDADLAFLARSHEAKIRAAVAEAPQTPLTTLLILASDAVPAVRAGVARNPRADLPVEVRETLARDKSIDVQFGLLKCPTLPDSVLARLAKSGAKDVASTAKERMKMRKTSGGAQPAFGQVGFASS
ncbi:MAG: hypothetical protein JW722_08675 [Demequinaceae bacterium]|nr:hypothetical protein [Demequinaceae bacterium]